MTINAVRKIISLTGPNCSFGNINSCRVDVLAGASTGYTPTVIVTNQTELNTQLAKTAAQLEGQVIGVQYNATPYVINRTGTGSLNTKAIGSGGLVITTYGATQAQFSTISIDDSTNITLYNLEVYTNSDGTIGSGLISLYDNCWNITIDSCKVHGKYYDPNGNYSAAGSYAQQWRGVIGSGALGKYRKDITIKDCEFYDLRRGFAMDVAGTFLVQGNTFHDLYEDPMSFSYSSADGGTPTTRVNWNTLYHPIGLASDVDNPHFDMIQFLDPGAGVTWTVEVLGNIGFIGDARGDFQGIFCNFSSAGAYLSGQIKGNVVLNRNLLSGIRIMDASSLTVIGNTCVSGDVNNGSINGSIFIGETTSTGTHTVKNNVTHAFSIAAGSSSVNGYSVSRTTSAYAAVFNGSAFDAATLSTKSAVLTAFAMKVGGSLDQTVNIGAVGSGYVDFNARTINGAME